MSSKCHYPECNILPCEGETQSEFCDTHREEGKIARFLIEMTSKCHYPECATRPTYIEEENQPQFCDDHREEGTKVLSKPVYKKVNTSRFALITYDYFYKITLSSNEIIRMVVFKYNDLYTCSISSVDFLSAILVVKKNTNVNNVKINNSRNIDILNDTDVFRCRFANNCFGDKGAFTTVLTVNGIYSLLYKKEKTKRTIINYDMVKEIYEKIISIMNYVDELQTSNLTQIKNYIDEQLK